MSITLVCVGNTNHELMKFAINKTQQCVPVDKVKVFSDRSLGVGKFYQLPKNFGLYEYSTFMVKDLNQYIDTDHVLICQYDGFGVNEEFWDNKYLQYDYIGSATHYKHPPLYKTLTECDIIKTLDQSWYSLGGGFCLRSKKLLNALADPKIKESFYNYVAGADWSCEDITIGIIYKKFLQENYGFKYGSIEDSIEFAAEILTGYNFCLGFHGWDQVPLFLSEDETLYYIKEYIQTNGSHNIDLHKIKRFIGFCYIKNYDVVIKYIKQVYKFF